MLPLIMWSLTAALVLFLATMAMSRLLRRPVGADVETQPMLDEKQSVHHPAEPQAPAKLPEHITESSVARDAWVLRMTQHVFDERHRGRYNVLVMNEELEYFFNPENVVEDTYSEYHSTDLEDGVSRGRTIKYRITVFRSGSLVNLGDGGDINWDWKGNFDRPSAKTLTFRPCVAGTHYQQDPWQALASK
ncbi:hypothetical protein BDV96DRAFT_688444 [Lophiotrema nucula]|uniref:Uncharacterized protein n=1 Tax=Lophiotrema nucula TaxID=690887 RepID=A0A6A5Z786_9PLEO|nr:hypothetical protein BDV96DRAFT_688444 [Lophiotrema nucula]